MRALLASVMAAMALLLQGCAATSVLSFAYERANEGECISVACAATAVVGYALDKMTEGDPAPCHRLNSVERALSTRCGAYVPGTLSTKDVTASGLPRCPLTLAARDPAHWAMLPELLARGAQPEACQQAPMAALAQAVPCPDFTAASAPALEALRWLAQADARAIDHDVMRMLSCPAARAAGLDSVLDGWLAQGLLPAQGLPFGTLSALHPTHLDSRLARLLEASGHTARAGLGAYIGRLPSGFEAALREGDRVALDWWLDRVPELSNRVPPRQGNQLPWLPLARVITPTYLAHPAQQAELVAYLMSRGADPQRPLPHDPGHTVLSFARELKSPSLALLDRPVAGGPPLPRIGLSAAAVVGAAVP